jgi:hypothetical protein
MLLLAVLAAQAGCSTCASNCPATVFDVLATTGENLNIATAQLVGPACLSSFAECRGDFTGANACARLSIIGSGPGACELDITFSDGRDPIKAPTTFGPETQQGCCHGFPVVGSTSFTIPPLHPAVGFDAAVDTTDAAPQAGDGAVEATANVDSSAPDSSADGL